MTNGTCGAGCRCASDTHDMKQDAGCAVEAASLMLDKDGKCPCGKSEENCCHKDKLEK